MSEADCAYTLNAEDLELLARAAYLTGRETLSTETWKRAHKAFLNQDSTKQAAYGAFWLGMILFNQGDKAQGGGWRARAGRLVDDLQKECAEQAFLLIPQALQYLGKGNPETAGDLFSRAVEIGNRFDNPDLLNPARRLGHPIRACLQKPPARSPTMQQSTIYPSMHMPRPIRSSQTPIGSELMV